MYHIEYRYSTVTYVSVSTIAKLHCCSIFGKEYAVEIASGNRRFLVIFIQLRLSLMSLLSIS